MYKAMLFSKLHAGHRNEKKEIYVYINMRLEHLVLYFEHMNSFNFVIYQVSILGGAEHVT
jgi:hypothetical protein